MRPKRVLFLAITFAGVLMASVMGHIPISHDHSTSICWGYAQGRAFGKSEGDAECDPATTYAESINESYFPFIAGASLEGIKPGDIVVFGQVRQGLQGHAAYVVEVPASGTIWGIRVDQVPSKGGSPQHYLTLQQVKDQGHGNPVGYHRGSGAATVTLTFKNSFQSGEINVGKDKNGNWLKKPSGWSNSFFVGSQLEISAIDPQQDGSGNTQRYQFWKFNGASIGNENPRTITISSSGTYQAEFRKEFSVTFQNSLPGASGGQIKIDNIIESAPHTKRILEDTPPLSVSAEALDQVINSIRYTFSHWDDAVTTNPRNYQITRNATYTANFNAKPLPPPNVSAGGPVGSYVQVTWSEHPHPSVTQYQIWRRVRQQGAGQTGPPQLLATVSRGTLSYTDHEFLLTEYYTHDMLQCMRATGDLLRWLASIQARA